MTIITVVIVNVIIYIYILPYLESLKMSIINDKQFFVFLIANCINLKNF